ncbi:hypothetical protein [Caballeronia sp. dw_19]|uniref:hypothetical protein n=1 Tax=Caballeronia sp. dw_19 TaxID=2719791 RepID=UPI001BCEA952|nr:hypothetical protein [Caballeronia sp. dw_19]
MKVARNAIAAAVMALAASAAMAHGNQIQQSGSVEGQIGAQVNTFQGSGNVGASSISSGSAVTAGEVLGTGGFQEAASGKTAGVAGGSLIVSPTGVTTSSFTDQSSVSKGSGSTWGNVPVTAADGSIITGNQVFGSVTNNAVSAGTFATQAVGANGAFEANGAIEANGSNFY